MAMIYIEVCYSRTDSKSHWLLSNDPARQLMSVDGWILLKFDSQGNRFSILQITLTLRDFQDGKAKRIER